MLIEMCKSKIGHATVTASELYYEGSITIDEKVMKAVDILPGEKVEVLNVNNGQRFTTYTIVGKAGSGTICLNGPAARLGVVGDKLFILSYASMDQEEARKHRMKIVHLDEDNRIKK